MTEIMRNCPYCGGAVSLADISAAKNDKAVQVDCGQCGNVFSAPLLEPAPEPETSSDEDKRSVSKLLAEGNSLLKQKRHKEASLMLLAASEKAPDRIDILKSLAQACSKSNLAYEALSAYTKILRIDPDNEGALFKAGMLYVQQRRFDHGIKSLKRLLAIDPGNSQAELMLRIAESGKNQAAAKKDDGQKRVGGTLPQPWPERIYELVQSSGASTLVFVALWMIPLLLFAYTYGNYSSDSKVMTGLMIAMMLYSVMLSVAVHELGHGLAAFLLGDETPFDTGSLTLNPARYVSIVGTLAVPAGVYTLTGIMFGWARPTSFNKVRLSMWPRDQVIVAGAGPLASFILSYAMFTLFLVLASAYNNVHDTTQIYFSTDLSSRFDMENGLFAPLWFLGLEISSMTAIISLVTGVFSLLPIHPLDGSELLALALPPEWAARIRAGFAPGLAIVAAALYLGWTVYMFFPAYLVLAGYHILANNIL